MILRNILIITSLYFSGVIDQRCFGQSAGIDTVSEKSDVQNQRYIELYKENSEVSYTAPFGEIGAPSTYVIEGRLTTIYMLLGTKNSRVAFSVIPDFTVRVRSENSAGVRTPSFRLGGTGYYRIGSDNERYRYAEFSFTHHSNGQDGKALNDDGSINTHNGNFSTNYLTASYRFGRVDNLVAGAANSYSLNHRAGIEWHKWFAYEPALKSDYGFTRLLYNFSWRCYSNYFSTGSNASWKKNNARNRRQLAGKPVDARLEKEAVRVNLELTYAVNRMAPYHAAAVRKRLNAEISSQYSLPFMNRAMFMLAAGYYGEDPYNIYYRDRYAFVRAGISAGFTRYIVRKEKQR